MTMLSVNLNKVALLRNAREGERPSVSEAAAICLEAGAGGITLHPRPDRRHARPGDVRELSRLVRSVTGAELNIEGNPYPDFIDLVCETQPTQCTLVPDSPDVLTSDHGWDLATDGERLQPLMKALRAAGIRVSLFMEPDPEQIARAKAIGADRIELYTEPYARAYGTSDEDAQLEKFSAAARCAQSLGLGVNAGHDLNLQNLGPFQRAVPLLLEVSIGHALISSSLEFGLTAAVRAYLEVLEPRNERRTVRVELGSSRLL